MTDQNPTPAPDPKQTNADAPAQAGPPADVKGEAPPAERAVPERAGRAVPEDDSASPFSVTVGKIYEGPLDLLLDLVRKQNIDIYDIPIAKITAQFLAYVEHLKASDVDTAGEFIYMSALLIHIKSKMLLPRDPLESAEGGGEDPRHELVERLLEHERFRNAAQMLQQKRQLEEATWTNPGMRDFRETADADQDIAADTLDLVRVFREVLERAKNRPVLDVQEDAVTVRQMIDFVRRRMMMEERPVALSKLLSHTRSPNAVIAMFLALLELVRLQAVLLRQDRNFSEIYIKKHEQFEQVINDRLAVKDDWS
jgi:segregation and condensation protein A